MLIRALLSLMVALLCVGAVQAGDFEDGVAAYERQDYATAAKSSKSSGKKSTAAAKA